MWKTVPLIFQILAIGDGGKQCLSPDSWGYIG